MNYELVKDCWNKIGVSGDSSCDLLKTVTHCRNCSIYASAGRALLQREAPAGYESEWTSLLMQPFPTAKVREIIEYDNLNPKASTTSVIVFRLEEEWFALPVWTIKEVTSLCPIHTLPHPSNDILLGIVNIRGEILICISLSNILGLRASNWKTHVNDKKSDLNPVLYQRLVVMEIQENRWAFVVDEIFSIQRIPKDELVEAPTVVTKTPDTYTKKIINWQDKKVNLLDNELLFYELLFYTFSRPQ